MEKGCLNIQKREQLVAEMEIVVVCTESLVVNSIFAFVFLSLLNGKWLNFLGLSLVDLILLFLKICMNTLF